jgi:nicotinate-nucleotide adenylyltransferase
MSRRAGVLTGTFDPVHLGHVELAEAAVRRFGLEFVLLWVNAEAGHKTGVTPYADRVAMVKLATAGHDGLLVYEDDGAMRPHRMKSFLGLSSEYPGTELLYLVGADTFALLDRWDDIESVVDQATFGVAERPGAQADVVGQVRARLGGLGARLKAQTFELEEHTRASSRRIRDAVREGRRPESLDPAVYEYVRAHDLYR